MQFCKWISERGCVAKDMAGIKSIAVEDGNLINNYAGEFLIPKGTIVRYEYSPGPSTGTGLHFAVDVRGEIMRMLAPVAGQQVIINVQATVEMATPNQADQIEGIEL